ncbi:F-box protein At3g07870 isoform X2 [Neltuma alba]|uniref:F-box protein At3g07870 isoform X2 n=1 Tax=Neltuma alba TaxID=207710 RepID=UPI0010A3B78D|nr:F-box protein At3g07870-like isoform X2 [Prosopis alba]
MNRKKKRGAGNLASSSLEETEPALPWTGQCKIQTLPPNIVIDILSRLPIKSILSCKRVCKAWLRLILHPRFVELQLARSSASILIKTIPSLSESRKIILTHVDQRGRDPYRFDKLMLTPKINLPCSKFGLVNSCNGLLCLSGVEKDDPIWVCNPILGEYVTIPPASEGRNSGSFVGLGFCAATNRYKVLQTFHPKVKWSGNDYLDAEIYHMDTGTWKSIGYAPCALVAPSFNSFLRGSLHWVPSAGGSSEYIYSFNFETEEFGSVSPPPCLDGTKRQISNDLRLGVVEGCLFVCVFGDSRKFDIWVMKDYGVKESWTRQYVIENLYPRKSHSDFYEPVKFMGNGEILMLYNDSEVLCYNTGTKRLRRTRVTHTRHEFNSIALTPSLVSLYHVAKGELVQRVQGSKEYVKSSAEGTAEYAASFETSTYELAGVNTNLNSVSNGSPVQREPVQKKFAKSSAAQGNVECLSFGTVPNQPAGFNSTPFYGQRVIYQLNPDQSTEYMNAANAESLGRISAQGFSAPPVDDVSSNLASKKSLPRWWQWEMRK